MLPDNTRPPVDMSDRLWAVLHEYGVRTESDMAFLDEIAVKCVATNILHETNRSLPDYIIQAKADGLMTELKYILSEMKLSFGDFAHIPDDGAPPIAVMTHFMKMQPRTVKALDNANIWNLAQLTHMSKEQVMNLRNVGTGTLMDIEKAMTRFGVGFRTTK